MRIKAALFGVAGLAGILTGHAQATDLKHYCSDTGRNVLVYVDVSTPYDDIDKRALSDGIAQVFESLTGGDRLSIRTIEDAFPKSTSLIDACKPYCPPEGMLGDLFSQCTEGVVINDTKALRHSVAEALRRRLANAIELPHSDIIRTIAMKSPEEFIEGRDNEIFIFSDMIENSEYLPGASFFSSANDKIVEQLSKDRLIPNLMGAEVTVVGVGRGGSEARVALAPERLNKLQDFWRLFFAATGASATLR
jgi:hypothetical protein